MPCMSMYRCAERLSRIDDDNGEINSQ